VSPGFVGELEGDEEGISEGARDGEREGVLVLWSSTTP